MTLHPVCKVSELKPGERKIVEVGGRSIGVFNVDGTYYALRNLCPHQFAPLCLGKITGYCGDSPVSEFIWSREGEIIRCPWHAWEFDIKTGKSIFDPKKVRTKCYPVSVDEAPVGELSVEGFSVSVREKTVFLELH